MNSRQRFLIVMAEIDREWLQRSISAGILKQKTSLAIDLCRFKAMIDNRTSASGQQVRNSSLWRPRRRPCQELRSKLCSSDNSVKISGVLPFVKFIPFVNSMIPLFQNMSVIAEYQFNTGILNWVGLSVKWLMRQVRLARLYAADLKTKG